MIEQLSIDLSNYCSKGCSFCYNRSNHKGNTLWKPEEVIHFCLDCLEHGVKAVSLGGGEPFEYEGVFEVIQSLYPKCYLTVTSNGLPLENLDIWNALIRHAPDKLHLTIHRPANEDEVIRILGLLQRLKSTSIKPGLNLLVGANNVEACQEVFKRMLEVLELDQIILIPQRFSNTPTPKQLALVAQGKPFQSPSCILGCQRPQSFCSVSWDKRVNVCSYADGKVALPSLDYKGLEEALSLIKWNEVQKCAN